MDIHGHGHGVAEVSVTPAWRKSSGSAIREAIPLNYEVYNTNHPYLDLVVTGPPLQRLEFSGFHLRSTPAKRTHKPGIISASIPVTKLQQTHVSTSY
ncbi:hypothetical protein WAI453_001940 [Rhynchosporium graminicola]